MRLFFLYIFLSGLSFTSLAQHVNFRNVSTKDGLSSNLVYRVFEDKNGYFWYLTDKGVSRFDGTKWKAFASADGYNELGAFHIIETPDGAIWIVSTNFKLYCFRDQKFTKINTTFSISWIEAEGNEVWAFSREQLLFKVNKDGLLLSSVTKLTINKPSTYYSFVRLDNGSFLIATNRGIYEIKKNLSPELRLATDGSTLIVPRMFKRTNGNILLSNNKGIYEYNPNTKGITLFYSLKNNELISFYEDADGMILGTFNGFYKGNFAHLGRKSAPIFFEGDIITSVIRSHSGVYYFATINAGVYYSNFQALHINAKEGLQQECIAFIKMLKKKKYVFTKSGLVYQLNEDNKKVHKVLIQKFGELGKIYNIVSLSDSQLLIGSNQLYLYSEEKLAQLDSSKIIHKYYLACYNKDTFSGGGILNIISNSDTVMKYHKMMNDFFHDYKFNLKVDHSLLNTGKKIYFQIEDGLLEIEYNGRGIVNHHVYHGIDFISDVKINISGTLIVTTMDKGIFLITQNRVSQFSLKDGLASDYCTKCYIRGSFVWVCTNKGVSKVELDRADRVRSVMTYSSDNYLLDDQVNDLCFDRKYVYVATDKGVSFFGLNDYSNIKVPSVFVESIRINNEEVSIDSLKELSYDRNNISISYSSPREWNGNNLFKYVFDKGDTLYTKSTELSYGSLLPGEYTLKVWGRNQNGIWSNDPAEIAFVILRPFWKTPWFIVLVVASGIILILLFLLYRFNQLKKRNAIEAQLLDSELKALRLHMNPHFIFNTLNSLQKFILERNPLESNKYIAMFAKLMRWIMSYSDKQHITLEEELTFLDTYIALEQLRFDRLFKVVKEIDETIEPMYTYIPVFVIQPFVENAIKYGIAGLNKQGELHLRFEQYDEYLLITIQDNGVGREIVKKEQQLSGKEYESTGIKYTNERLLLLLERKLKITNAVTVTDLYEDGKPSGTRAELIIPYYNE